MTTTPYDTTIANKALPLAERQWAVAQREGYLARAAEDDAVKKALVRACEAALVELRIAYHAYQQADGSEVAPIPELVAALALAQKEATP